MQNIDAMHTPRGFLPIPETPTLATGNSLFVEELCQLYYRCHSYMYSL